MDFEFSEEQRLLKESVERLLSDRYDFCLLYTSPSPRDS